MKKISQLFPKYLSIKQHDNDNLNITDNTIRFTYKIKEMFTLDIISTEIIPEIYLELIPTLEKNIHEIRKPIYNKSHILCGREFEYYYFPNRLSKIKNQIELYIMDIFYMNRNEFIKKQNNPLFLESIIDNYHNSSKKFYGVPLRRSYPVYFPISYDIQRYLQTKYNITNPPVTMMLSTFFYYIAKAGYSYEKLSNYERNMMIVMKTYMGIDFKYKKTENKNLILRNIRYTKQKLDNTIKNYYWKRRKSAILFRYEYRKKIFRNM